MKKIIDGKKYDTETSENVYATTYYLNSPKDPIPVKVQYTIYKKINGTFFSVHIKTYGDNDPFITWNVDESEIKRRAEKYIDVDSYEKIFGEVPE